MGGAWFLKPFPKSLKNWTLFKARKRIEVSVHIDFEHILFFRVSFLEFPFSFLDFLELFSKQIQNSIAYWDPEVC